MKPTLPQVLNAAISGALDEARVMMPGRIETYNTVTRRADVQPLIQDRVENEEGDEVAITLPVLSDVPVVFPGSGGARVRYPVSKGDEVMLVFASSSIARWKFKGGLVDPGDTRRHALPDVIAITGLQAIADDNDLLLEFTSAAMLLGGPTATQAVVKGTIYRSSEDTMLTAVQALCTALAAVTSPGYAAQAAATTAAAAIATFKAAAATYLSTSVKVL